jgi:Universal stress protein family
MAEIIDRPNEGTPSSVATGGPSRPVVLATLSVRIEANAERMAIESALEAGVPLIIANMLRMPAFATTMRLAPQYATLPHEEDLDAVRATAHRAAAWGIPTELLRIMSPRPLTALIELIQERRPGLVVLGPDVRRTSRWRLRMAARRVRSEADCLVWIAPDG